MKPCAKCGVVKELTDFHRLRSRRDGRKSYCKLCQKKDNAKRYLANIDHCKAVGAAWRQANAEKLDTARLVWAEKNKERIKTVAAKWYKAKVASGADPSSWRKANPEKYKAIKRKYLKKNMAKWNGYCADRLARKLKATPVWANKFFISEAYDLAHRRTNATGFKWHVDHIVPLRSPSVCGLHVEVNLQVIPWVTNLRKQNQYWPDMP